MKVVGEFVYKIGKNSRLRYIIKVENYYKVSKYNFKSPVPVGYSKFSSGRNFKSIDAILTSYTYSNIQSHTIYKTKNKWL